jgi:sphingomyelin phosphodiesterase
MQVLHITDAHIDPEYTPGNNALCKELSCCRKEQGQPSDKSEEAGYWGDYRDCDSPPYAFTNLVQQAAKSHPVSFIKYSSTSTVQ